MTILFDLIIDNVLNFAKLCLICDCPFLFDNVLNVAKLVHCL